MVDIIMNQRDKMKLSDLRVLNDYTTSAFTKNTTRPATLAHLRAVLEAEGAKRAIVRRDIGGTQKMSGVEPGSYLVWRIEEVDE